MDSRPIAKAIEKEGEDAIEPLLQCLASDKRLTRSVSFGRDFAPHRNLIPVATVAYLALAHIFQTYEFGIASGEYGSGVGHSRQEVANEIRAYWKKNKGRSAAERWYATLADDKANPAQWIEAVGHIVQPADVEVRGGLILSPIHLTDKTPPMGGEELRKKSNPSVSELIARRVPQIAASSDGNSGAIFRGNDATKIALMLHTWDSKASVPVLRAQIQDCNAKVDEWSGDSSVESLTRDIADLTAALSEAGGDEQSLKDYAVWIMREKPDSQVGWNDAKPFEVMWQHPDYPDIALAAKKIFSDPKSGWYCRVKGDIFEMTPNGELTASPLLAVSAFRANVLDNLHDLTEIATVTVANQRITVKHGTDGMFTIESAYDAADPLLPRAAEQRTVRVGDWYAYKLAQLDGSPEFELYWPQEKRDEAITVSAVFAEHWGPAFRYTELQKSFNLSGYVPPHATFPQRDRPATDTDVRSATAVFALPAVAEKRVVAMKRFPPVARWIALKQFPIRYESIDLKTGEKSIEQRFDQRGLIWQTEEQMESGSVITGL